jgi:hypothetical protein
MLVKDSMGETRNFGFDALIIDISACLSIRKRYRFGYCCLKTHEEMGPPVGFMVLRPAVVDQTGMMLV